MNKVIKSGLLVSLLMVAASSFAVAPARVPATGETGGAAGSDKGVAWPSPRFIEGSGQTADCITDKLTGLMWPKNGIIGFESTNGRVLQTQPDYANITANLNQISWNNALAAVVNMNTASTKLCGYSDWRLPNKVELKSLVNYGYKGGTNKYQSEWLISQGFSNVQAGHYWSSSTAASYTNIAWVVNFLNGNVSAPNKTLANYVWPVRGGL